MSRKRELAREIRLLEGELVGLEGKRSRSQAAIIIALLEEKKPDPVDVEYFRTYTAQIEVKRERLTELIKSLEALL